MYNLFTFQEFDIFSIFQNSQNSTKMDLQIADFQSSKYFVV